MRTAITALSFALVSGLTLTPLIRGYALGRGLVDHGLTSRKIHRRPIPRLGGVGIVAAFFAGLVIVMPMSGSAWLAADPRLLAGLIVGGLSIAALGFYDDLRGVSARNKFAVQLGVAALSWSLGYRIDVLALPFLGIVDLGPFGLPITVLWIAGIINALNLIDGLDGLAAGVSLVVLVSLFSLALGVGDPLLMLLTATLAGAVVGFLCFNVHPASIFMGDTGSMFIGFVLAVVSIQASHTSSNHVSMLVPIIALGYPIADTLLAMARRAARGVPMSSADRAHIHHRLLSRGFSQRQTAILLSAVSACLCGVAFIVFTATDLEALIALACLGGALLVAMRWLGFLDWSKLRDLAAARRGNVERLHRVSELAAQLQRAADPEALGASIAALGTALHVEHVTLAAQGRSWAYGSDSKPDLLVVRYPLQPELSSGDVLEVGWTRGTVEQDRDTEIAIEQLCPHLRAALRRLGPAHHAPAVVPVRGRDRLPGAAGRVGGELRALVHGKRTLVTGAAGKIGAELCRQLARRGVSELVMVDMNENALYLGARKLEREAPEIALFPEVVNVREYERLLRLCVQHRPQLVLHAAAHTCVSFMEDAPEEAVKNNVFGTLNVVVAAHEVGAEQLVVLSTDEAENPTSVVGATKRIAELVVRDLAARSSTSMTAVRFGDVFDDASGVPASAAVRLVLLAGLGRHGDLCLVDSRGRSQRGPLERDGHARVRSRISVANGSLSPPDLSRQLHDLQEHAMAGDREALLSAIQRLVPTFHRAPRQQEASVPTPLAAVHLRRRAPTPPPGGGAEAEVVVGAAVSAARGGTPVPAGALSVVSVSDEGGPQRRVPGAGWWQSIMTR